MSDDGVLRRMPASVQGGNGIDVTYQGGAFRVSADLQTLSITPPGASAPVNLAQAVGTLMAHDDADRFITQVDDGFFDIPGSGNAVKIDDGWF